MHAGAVRDVQVIFLTLCGRGSPSEARAASPHPWQCPKTARLLVRQSNGVDVPAIVGFAAMRGAPIAEKPVGIGISAQPEILHLADGGALEPPGDVAGKIEHGVALAF